MPKKNVNQVLYQMLKESKVSQERPAMWGLGQGGTREVEPAEPARPSQAELPQQDVAAAPEEPGRQLTKQRKQPACPNPPWPLVMLLLSRPPRGAHKEAGLSQHSGSGLMAGQAP